MGIEISSPKKRGPGIRAATIGAKKINPAVARTLKIKPASKAWKGFISNKIEIATASEFAPALFRPLSFEIKKTSAITPARSTEGVGRTNKTKVKRTKMVMITWILLSGKKIPIRAKMKALTIAKFAPLTAVKWERPASSISSVRALLCNEVSPMTMPGIREAESPPTFEVSSRNALRTRSKARSMNGELIFTKDAGSANSKAATLRSLD